MCSFKNVILYRYILDLLCCKVTVSRKLIVILIALDTNNYTLYLISDIIIIDWGLQPLL